MLERITKRVGNSVSAAPVSPAPSSPGQQAAHGQRALAAGVLVDRGQPEDLAEFVAVDADHGQVVGHPEPEVAGGEDGADRHLIGRREDRCGPLHGAAEQVPGAGVGALDGEVGGDLPFRADRQPGVVHGLLESGLARARQAEVLLVGGVAGHVGDLAVAELDQVAGRGPGDAGIVDADGGGPGQRTADPDDGPVDGEQLLDLGLAELQRHGNHRIHTLAQQEVVQHAVPAFLPPADVVEREVVAGVQQGRRDAFHDRGKEPAGARKEPQRPRCGSVRRPGWTRGTRGRTRVRPRHFGRVPGCGPRHFPCRSRPAKRWLWRGQRAQRRP